MWSKGQVKTFVKEVHRRVGDGWHFCVPPVQRALIAEKTLDVVRIQARETISVEDINKLYHAMLVEAGLE